MTGYNSTMPPHTGTHLVSVSEQPIILRNHFIAFFDAAQTQDMVVCRAQIGCTGTDLGVMTPRKCCVQNENGLSYQVPGQEICTVCVGKCANLNLYFVPKSCYG